MSKPLILLTNDDGYQAKGLKTLAASLADLGDLWVVAPHTEKSAISHAITLWDPVRIHDHTGQVFSVTGTPTDCVYIALAKLLPRKPDLCVSGINHGANLGDDVIYSGTVAGASEATLSDIPSVAVSLASYRSREFDEAGAIARRVAREVLERGLPRGVMLNVNVPAGATRHTPTAVTKLGRRYYGKIVEEKEDPRHKPYFWIGGSELGFDDIPGSDCNAVARDLVSISPVSMDLTCYRTLREVREWSGLQSDAEGE